mmetsp:Transcript_85513/g.267530  ORF Transcript_85513/g.267530 Transcript_85513/m.267530 type:complete len:296 (+) Transcript_85513:75-962(+)
MLPLLSLRCTLAASSPTAAITSERLPSWGMASEKCRTMRSTTVEASTTEVFLKGFGSSSPVRYLLCLSSKKMSRSSISAPEANKMSLCCFLQRSSANSARCLILTNCSSFLSRKLCKGGDTARGSCGWTVFVRGTERFASQCAITLATTELDRPWLNRGLGVPLLATDCLAEGGGPRGLLAVEGTLVEGVAICRVHEAVISGSAGGSLRMYASSSSPSSFLSFAFSSLFSFWSANIFCLPSSVSLLRDCWVVVHLSLSFRRVSLRPNPWLLRTASSSNTYWACASEASLAVAYLP